MVSVASSPAPSTPYTFHVTSDIDGYLDAHARMDRPEMHYDVIADLSWPGLRHAARMDGLLGLSRIIGLLSGIPIAIAYGEGAWIAMGIFLGVAALPLILMCVWYPMIPNSRVIFDWRARTIRGRTYGGHPRDVGPVLALDHARFEVAPAPHGHAVWARGPGVTGRLVGYFQDADVAHAYRDRIERLVRNKRYLPSA